MTNIAYDRQKAVDYSQQWALSRNPKYWNFDGMGGDCTNFISQCLFAGCGVMNYTMDTGWYFRHINDRAPAWSGVEPLHEFLLANKREGPYGHEIPLLKVEPGDIIQLSYDGIVFGHSVIVVRTWPWTAVAQHSEGQNFARRQFNAYRYKKARAVHIDGARR